MLIQFTIKASTDRNRDLEKISTFLADVAVVYRAACYLANPDSYAMVSNARDSSEFPSLHIHDRLYVKNLRVGSLTLVAIAAGTSGTIIATRALIECIQKITDWKIDRKIKVETLKKLERENQTRDTSQKTSEKLDRMIEGQDQSALGTAVHNAAESLRETPVQINAVTVKVLEEDASVDEHLHSPKRPTLAKPQAMIPRAIDISKLHEGFDANLLATIKAFLKQHDGKKQIPEAVLTVLRQYVERWDRIE